MTIDRTALRRIADKYRDGKWQGMGTELLVGLDAAIIELDAADRRIAELEAELTAATDQSDSWRTQAKQLSKRVTQLEHVNLETVRITGNRQEATDRCVTDLELRLSIATELNVNDRKRIAELEAQNAALQTGLREALRWHRPLTYKDLLEVKGGHETQLVPRDVRVGSEWLHDVMARLEKLLPSESK